jgi:hypothetical protein
MDISSLMNSPQTYAIKKYLSDVLKEYYPQDDSIIDRIAKSLVTEKDLNDFNKLIVSIYTVGFAEAARQNKEMFEKLGYKINIKLPEPEAPKIFK